MANEDFVVRFELDVAAAQANAQKLAQTLGTLTTSISTLGRDVPTLESNTVATARSFDTASRSVKQYTDSVSQGARATKAAADEMRKANEIARNFQNLPDQGSDTRRVGSSFGNIVDVDDQRTQQASRAYSNLSTEIDGVIDARRRESSAFASSLQARLQEEAATKSLTSSLPTLRYALYDVAQSVTVVSTAMLGLSVATLGVSIAWERNFANVIRTSNLAGASEQIQTLRENFQDLASTIPVTSRELAEIGTLGGQLGIAAGDLTNFTSTVARFSATTDLSVDQAATAFGRLNALLPDVQGNYEALGSSILRVGVNSVATEAEIAKIATQLSGMAAVAGLSADEVIGLAGALASVGVQPELARGTITRTLTLMSQAATEGGESLERFAQISGVSAQEFASAYGTDRMGGVFLDFINGLNDIVARGGDANQALVDLGITSVRDRPALLRLAIAMDSTGKSGGLLAQTLNDAKIGFENATELADQYGVISSTVAAKLQVLVNNFENLMTVIGGGGTIIGGAIDLLNGLLETFTEIARNPVASVITNIVLVLTALLGVAGLVGAAALTGVAGLAAMYSVLGTLPGVTLPATLSLTGLSTALAGTGVAGQVASKALVGLRGGLIGLVAVAGAGAQFAWITGLTGGVRDLVAGIQGLDLGKMTDLIEITSGNGYFTSDGFASWVDEIKRGGADFGLAWETTPNAIKNVDNQLKELIQTGQGTTAIGILEGLAEADNTTLEQVLTKLPEVRKQLELLDQANGGTGDAALGAAAAVQEETDALTELASQLNISSEAAQKFRDGLMSGSADFLNFSTILTDLQAETRAWAEAQAEATEDTSDSWATFYNGTSVSIEAFSARLGEQITEQQAWATDLGLIAGLGAENFAASLAQMGPAGAEIARQAVNLTSEELFKLEEQAALAAFLSSEAFANSFLGNTEVMVAAYEQGGIAAVQGLIAAQIEESRAGVPGAVQVFVDTYMDTYNGMPLNLPVSANTSPAEAALNDFIYRMSYRSVTIRVNTEGGRDVGIVGYEARAAGGYIAGPGTGTSDSIPAMLSNGEYVVKAASVRKYGTGLFDQLNRGVAKFANGGSVGAGSMSFPSSMITEWSPQDRARFDGLQNQVTVLINQDTIGKASNGYNVSTGNRGRG